jgi:MSHA pilin protein MshC
MSPFRHPLATRRGAPGFTLIELVMVLVLLGILAIFVIPRPDLVRGFDEVGYRDAVRATLEFARKSAVAQRRSVRVSLAGNNLILDIDNVGPGDPGAGSYPRNLSLPTPDPRCGGPANQLCAPPGVTLGGPATLTFSPLGRPSAAANYSVTGDAPWTITVEAETGHVH